MSFIYLSIYYIEPDLYYKKKTRLLMIVNSTMFSINSLIKRAKYWNIFCIMQEGLKILL